VVAKHVGWTGLGPVGANHIGHDLATRSLDRFRRVLGWLDAGRLRPGLTLPGVAAASLVLWADARGGGHEPVPPPLRALTEALAARPSFRRSVPPPWSPGA
jgi:hypothetical protein